MFFQKDFIKYFFCCKLFRKGFGKGQLANEGFDDWTDLGIRIQEHEISMEYI